MIRITTYNVQIKLFLSVDKMYIKVDEIYVDKRTRERAVFAELRMFQ